MPIRRTVRFYKDLSLTAKFSLTISAVAVLVGILSIVVITRFQERSVLGEVEKRARGLTSVLVHSSVQAVLSDDYLLLQEIIDSIVEKEDVAYAMIFDNDGRVIVHSRTIKRGEVCTDSLSQKIAASEIGLFEAFRDRDGSPMWDVSMPIRVTILDEHKIASARIGFSLKRTYGEIAKIRNQIILIGILGIVLAIAISWYLSKVVAGPVKRLVEATRWIGSGEFSYRVDIDRKDEIGRLASEFNHMAEQLLQRRVELNQKVGELSTLTNYNMGILESMSSGVITVDIDGKVATLNKSAERIIGVDESSASGKQIEGVIPGCSTLTSAIMEALSGGDVYDEEAELVRVGGYKVVLRFSTRILRSGDGEPIGALAVFSDVTELKEMEKEVRQAEKMAALGSTAASIAHEIKTPLTSFRAFTELLPRKYNSTSFRDRFVKTVLPQVDRLSVLVNDLLDFGRVRNPLLRSTDVNEVLESSAELLGNALHEKDVELVWKFSAIPLAQLDPDQVTQVFINIMKNAIDSMPDGGSLEISTDVVRRVFRSKGSSAKPRYWIKVSVSDTGCGIPAEDIDRIFDPFFSSKPRGTGLGLAISYGIVRDHGGSISVKSSVGTGTTFDIFLPLRADGKVEAQSLSKQ